MIVVNCSSCGFQRLDPHQIRLEVCATAVSFQFRFCCPRCAVSVVRACDARTAAQLVAAGCPTVTWSPTELERRPNGPVLTEADVERFCALLDDDAACGTALTSLRATF